MKGKVLRFFFSRINEQFSLSGTLLTSSNSRATTSTTVHHSEQAYNYFPPKTQYLSQRVSSPSHYNGEGTRRASFSSPLNTRLAHRPLRRGMKNCWVASLTLGSVAPLHLRFCQVCCASHSAASVLLVRVSPRNGEGLREENRIAAPKIKEIVDRLKLQNRRGNEV